MSSDWSTHVFVIRHVKNVINMPRKFMSVNAKQRQKLWGTNWLINTLFSCNISSHQKFSVKKDVLKNFAVSESLFIKVTGWKSATLLKYRLQHRCFPFNFMEISRTHFYRKPLINCLWILRFCFSLNFLENFIER